MSELILNSKSCSAAVILLDLYNWAGMGDPQMRSDEVHELAVAFDESVISLDGNGLTEMISDLTARRDKNREIRLTLKDERDYLATLAAAAYYGLNEASDHHLDQDDKEIAAVILENCVSLLKINFQTA